MFKGDEDEEESGLGATRYPVMPSLIALQQMRNRLHLAYLGKKLMKWTAMATGKELRRLSLEMNVTFKDYAEDMCQAFMLLARARYFYPHLNDAVLENVPLTSSITVGSGSRSMAGVKLTMRAIQLSGVDPYPHLGLEKGGMAIQDAKHAWLNMVKFMVIIIQERTSFLQLEAAYKSATKRENVLTHLVIPRTDITIDYIKGELDEKAREEFFRIKKIIQVKAKRKLRKLKHQGSKKKLLEEPPETVSSPIEIPYAPQIGDYEKCAFCDAEMNERKLKDEAKLELFSAQISEIINTARDVEKCGILEPTIEHFLNTAEELQEKLKLKVAKSERELPAPMCEYCREKMDEELAERQMPFLEQTISEKPLLEPPFLEQPIPEKPSLQQNVQEPVKKVPKRDSKVSFRYPMSPAISGTTDMELGTYETDVQEITKIIRVKNLDGTISQEKRVITIVKETRAPTRARPPPPPPPINPSEFSGRVMYESSDTSSKSYQYQPQPETMIISVKDSNPFSNEQNDVWQTTSEIITRSPPMAYPIIRSCISSASAYSIDSDFDDYCINCIISDRDLSVNNLKGFLGKTEIVDFISFNPFLNSNTNKFDLLYVCDILTDSEAQLVSDVNKKKSKLNSKSVNDVTKKPIITEKKELKKSVSFIININERENLDAI